MLILKANPLRLSSMPIRSRKTEDAARHVAGLKAGVAAQDKAIARIEHVLAAASPREKPALEDDLKYMKAARDNSRHVLVKAEEQLQDALLRHQQAQHEACGLSEGVTPRVNTMAGSVQESLRSVAEGMRAMFAEADAIKVLGIDIRAYANKSAVLSAMHAAGLGEFVNLHPVHDPKTLPQSIEMWGYNVRQRKAQLKKPKGA